VPEFTLGTYLGFPDDSDHLVAMAALDIDLRLALPLQVKDPFVAGRTLNYLFQNNSFHSNDFAILRSHRAKKEA
jgi:hypothetical protein